MARISPICKKCKIFISALKSPSYRDFMIKKSLESKRSKSHTWAPLSSGKHATHVFCRPSPIPLCSELSFGLTVTLCTCATLLSTVSPGSLCFLFYPPVNPRLLGLRFMLGPLCKLDLLCLQDPLCKLDLLCLQDPLCKLDLQCLQDPLCKLDLLCLQDPLCKLDLLCLQGPLCYYSCRVYEIHVSG
jgi:hypothetical protein